MMHKKYKNYVLGIGASLLVTSTSLFADGAEQGQVRDRASEHGQGVATQGEVKQPSEERQEIRELRQDARQEMAENQAEHMVIDFATNSSELSDEHKSKIKQALAGSGEKEEVKLAVWSDKSWSAEANENKFSKEDKKLAEQRGKALKEYIENTFPKKDVEVITMTEEIGLFAKMFNTEEAEVKSIFAKKGQSSSQAQKGEQSKEAVLLRDNGGPGKAVVIVSGTK